MNLLYVVPDDRVAAAVANFASARGWPAPRLHRLAADAETVPAAAAGPECRAVLFCPAGTAEADLAAVVDALAAADADALVLGRRAPAAATPGDRLALQLLTGEDLADPFTPLLACPPELLVHQPFDTGAARLRLLVAAARGGFRVASAPVALAAGPAAVLPRGEMLGFLLRAFGRALVPWPYRRQARRPHRRARFGELLRHPGAFCRNLLRENATPAGLAAAAAAGMFLGTLPLIFLHTAAILYVAIRWRLNKVLAVSISQLCMPPLSPFACIELGHWLRHGHWLTEVGMREIVLEAHQRFWEWLLGSLVLAPVNAAMFAALVYGLAVWLRPEPNAERGTRSAEGGTGNSGM